MLLKMFATLFVFFSVMAGGTSTAAAETTPYEVPESIRGFDQIGTKMDVTDAEGEAAIAAVSKLTPEQFEALQINYKVGLISRILLMGHGSHLKQFISDLMNSLSVPTDRKEFDYRFSPSIFANASMGGSTLTTNAGLMGEARNVDEFAAIIAHEMTHANKEMMKALEDRTDITEILNKLEGANRLSPSQREELRADLGATERMIAAGFNPWAFYDFFRRMAAMEKQTWDLAINTRITNLISPEASAYRSTHPASDLRMAAIKAYIVYKSEKVDISQNVAKYKQFPLNLRILQTRLMIATRPLHSLWLLRTLNGVSTYTSVELLFQALAGVSLTHSLIQFATNSPLESIGALLSSFRDVLVKGVDKTISVAATGNTVELLQWAGTAVAAVTIRLSYTATQSVHLPAMKRHWRRVTGTLAKTTEKEQSPEQQRQLLSDMGSLGRYMNSVYASSGKYALALRHLNGLTWMRLRLTWMFSEQIDSYVNTLKAQARPLDEPETTHINELLNDLPAFFYSSPVVIDSLYSLYRLQYGKDLAPGNSLLRVSGEQNWSYMIRLRLWIKNQKTLAPNDRIQSAYWLAKMGLFDDAYRLIGYYPQELLDSVFSAETKDPELLKQLRFVVTAYIEGRATLLPDSQSLRGIQRDWITGLRFKEAFKTLAERLRSQTFTKAIPQTGWSWVQLRTLLDKADWASANRMLRESFHSVTELDAFLQTELVNRNADTQVLVSQLAKLIINNPEWVRNQDDVEILLSRDYFWPVMVSGWKSAWSELESNLSNLVQSLARRFPEAWKYDPHVAEKIHAIIVRTLKSNHQFPSTVEDQAEFWIRLSGRGVTSTADQLFSEFYPQVSGKLKEKVEFLALNQGRIWEPQIKIAIARKRIQSTSAYNALLTSSNLQQRRWNLNEVLLLAQSSLPERGHDYMELLEEISVRINSTREESATIHQAKTAGVGGARQEDQGLRILSQSLDEIVKWKAKDQWDFVLYLRGDIEATQQIENAFQQIGPERIRRIFQLLPTLVKTVTLDAFFDSPRGGLLGSSRSARKWSEVMVDHLMVGKSAKETFIARELLKSFLFALKATGNKALRSYVLSYLLAQPKDASGSGVMLKRTLEVFGIMGVKLGQFLAASGLLPEHMVKEVRELHEQARIPERENIWRDLEKIVGEKELKFVVKELLGAASLKYAVAALAPDAQEKIVLKILRLEAIAHTNLEFSILESMAKNLTKRNGKMFWIFGGIVNASRKAVERELKPAEEVEKSRLARSHIYHDASDEVFTVDVPHSVLYRDRLIVEEYAEGISFFKLPAEVQPIVAEKILRVEARALFANQPILYFDPDRHPGNYRIHVIQLPNGKIQLKISFRPIDYGQLLSHMTREDRDRVVELFALAEAGAKSGAADWMVEKIGMHFAMTPKMKRKLSASLRIHFPDTTYKPITSYFAVLSSMESAGLKIDIAYYDFIRALVQLNQYVPSLNKEPRNWLTPAEQFEALAREAGKNYRAEVKLSPYETALWAWQNPKGAYEEIKNRLSAQPSANVLPTLPADPPETDENADDDVESTTKSVRCEAFKRLK